MTAEEIERAARAWVDVPYRKKGRSRTGIDCLGLLVMIGRQFRVPHADDQEYHEWPETNHLILKRLAEFLVPMPMGSPKRGLVGAFAASVTLPGHVGIFTVKHDVDHLVHARISPPQVFEEPWEAIPLSELRLIRLYALPGMEGLSER